MCITILVCMFSQMSKRVLLQSPMQYVPVPFRMTTVIVPFAFGSILKTPDPFLIKTQVEPTTFWQVPINCYPNVDPDVDVTETC